MISSKEIRWFTQQKSDAITNWFSKHNENFNGEDMRTDYYLPQYKNETLSIKLREGNLEIKQRKGTPEIAIFSSNSKGYFESWVKWSFQVISNDPLISEIVDEKRYNWIAIEKERLSLKLTTDESGHLSEAHKDDEIPFGCVVDYTRVICMGQEWYSYGMEWFGNTIIDVDDDYIDTIIGDTNLNAEDSYGFARFLSEINQPKVAG
jgi:hypothetical protein